MLNWLRDRIAFRRWKRSPLGLALKNHCYNAFYAPEAVFAGWSDESKENHSRELHMILVQAQSAINSSIFIRESLVNYAVSFSDLAVCGLKETERENLPIYSDTPYISGSLHSHIRILSDHVEELSQLKFEQPDELSDDELIAFCNARAALMLFYCNGINIMRVAVEDDMRSEINWYHALVQATMVAAEGRLREKVGLPRLLPGLADEIVYLSFVDDVLSGDRNPLYLWTQRWPDRYLLGHGPSPWN